MIAEETAFLSVGELAEQIRSRKITSVELAELYLSRLEKYGKALGAVVTITRDRAMDEARAADREIAAGKYRGPLHGIPYGVKDLLATKGIPTTWGAAPYRDQVFDYDATVVARLQKAGGVLVAKLAMVELAGGLGYNNPDASFTGPGRTPWNTDHWSGGSSSGPGAATAAGLVGFAIGSETSGSILNPSMSCGLSGLRPTYGRVSRHGAMALCWTLDKLGPMCRAALDCGLVLDAIAGRDPLDATSAARSFRYTPATPLPARKFRLGVPKGVTENGLPEVRANFEAALKALEPFAEITTDVELPSFPQVTGVIVAAEGAAAFRDLILSGRTKELQNPVDRIGGDTAMMTLAVDYIDAMRIRTKMQPAWAPVWRKFDALIAPNGSVAPPISEDFDAPRTPGPRGPGLPERRPAGPGAFPPGLALVPTGNALGVPALALMNGFGPDHLPTSMQVMGGPFSEATLVGIGRTYQKVTDWHKQHPPLTGGRSATTGPAAIAWDERL